MRSQSQRLGKLLLLGQCETSSKTQPYFLSSVWAESLSTLGQVKEKEPSVDSQAATGKRRIKPPDKDR